MPWVPGDAHKHNKGLSSKQASKWSATANAVLRECESAGGKDCEGKAIRIANSSVQKGNKGNTKNNPGKHRKENRGKHGEM